MNKHAGSTLDSLFDEMGELEEVNARAAKKILAIQAERRMKDLGLTTTTLARRMHTSRNQIHRILDQGDAGITLKMLFRLGEALGVPLKVGFDVAAVGAPRRLRRTSTGSVLGRKTRSRPRRGRHQEVRA